MNKEKLIKQAQEMYAYEISEKSDLESGSFDDLWQSLYDVYKISVYKIIDELEDEELVLLKRWLEEAQTYTEAYINVEII